MGMITWAPNGLKRSVELHPDMDVEGLPAAGARAVRRIKKPAIRSLLTAIRHTQYRAWLGGEVCYDAAYRNGASNGI